MRRVFAVPGAQTMTEELPDVVLARIGVTRTRSYQVTAREIKRFAQAIGETSRLHHDEDYAKSTRYGTIVAPALFCQTLTYEDAPPSELLEDGSPLEVTVPIPAKRTVGGGSEYVVHRLVRAGEVINATSQLKNVYTKQGRSGLLYLVVVETRFTDRQDLPVATEVATYIKRI
jgi:hydroxyacyl-ACP dehydratase HTD2-like protein with hotdog domain